MADSTPQRRPEDHYREGPYAPYGIAIISKGGLPRWLFPWANQDRRGEDERE